MFLCEIINMFTYIQVYLFKSTMMDTQVYTYICDNHNRTCEEQPPAGSNHFWDFPQVVALHRLDCISIDLQVVNNHNFLISGTILIFFKYFLQFKNCLYLAYHVKFASCVIALRQNN